MSSFEAECQRLKLDITDPLPAEYFCCSKCSVYGHHCTSVFYDKLNHRCSCGGSMTKVVEKISESKAKACSNQGAFTKHTHTFLISNDLHMLPKDAGVLQIITVFGITDMEVTKSIKVDLGFNEIMNLLKASLTSPTPLSDFILNKTTQMKYSAILVSQPRQSLKYYKLKAVMQSSTGKLLYAQVENDFVEFLFSLLLIPLGKVEHLMCGRTCFKAINNLYRSIDDLRCSFANTSMGDRLKEPKLPHGCISENHILPLTQESFYGGGWSSFSSVKFPCGQGRYLTGSHTYKVEDDLTVTPYCPVSILSYLRENKIKLTDIKDVELKVGFNEGLSILAASLTSTTALTDALLNQKLNKQPKTEV